MRPLPAYVLAASVTAAAAAAAFGPLAAAFMLAFSLSALLLSASAAEEPGEFWRQNSKAPELSGVETLRRMNAKTRRRRFLAQLAARCLAALRLPRSR